MIGVLVYLVKQNLCGTRFGFDYDLVQCDYFATGREVRVKVNIAVDDAICGKWFK